jgi:YYY domain-containing protein
MPVKLIIRWRPLALFGLALLGLVLRLCGLNWDQGNSFHPDERQILFHVMTLSWPHSLAQFFDPVNSPLNPHFFAYGSFPIYLLALIGAVLVHVSPALDSMANLTLVGRALSALFDSGTILLTGWLGLLLTKDSAPGRPHAWNVALLAAALVAFTPFQLQLSHFYAVDTMLLFFVVLTIAACVRLIDTDRPMLWSFIAGVSYGLALATKFSAAPLAVPLCVAVLLRWYRRRDLFSAITELLAASLSCLLVFLIAQPYALLDMPKFVQQVVEQGDLARGSLDLPYVRQFAGTIPYVYEAQNMLFWGMGVTLGVAAFAGLLWFLWRVWRREAGSWLVVLSWVLVYSAITGSFYAKFMRYMLPVYPLLTLMAASALVSLAQQAKKIGQAARSRLHLVMPVLSYGAIALILAGTIFQGLALLNVYSQPNTRIQASRWMYSHLAPGSVLTYEQWDDPLPVPVDNHTPSMFVQATYPDASGQPTTGLDLYGDDTIAKAHQLATFLPTLNAITMATDRLDKSIPRLPFRYPLTIHYYHLLFSGQLGFHLAAQFENHPNLLGITLNDSNADESYSVFDHPTVRIFVRDNPYPYTSDQLFQKLMDGVQLPAPGAGLSGTQRSLLLSPQQISDDQQSPPFSMQFPANSFSNAVPLLCWWLALLLLGLCLYPLVFSLFRPLADRGYIFSKTIGVLLLAYLAWLLASLHVLAFSYLSLLLVLSFLLLSGFVAFVLQRRAVINFVRQRWRLLLLAEIMFSLAFLCFAGIRSLNPDLWNPYIGGEKPMELAFLNAVLRSPYMPPLDPWFAGGYINYYYYGYAIVGSLIKLTAIIPTTAFNLAIPTLFAMTFSGAVIIVYSFARSLPIALLGGYFAALIGNFNGLGQVKGQALALLAHVQPPAFDYWQSSRIIPFTINEFPFWSFLFSDLHPHVIDMPIAVLMLGILAALLLSARGVGEESVPSGVYRRSQMGLYLLAAFVFGTITTVNTWDMPVYALLLAAVLLIRTYQEHGQEAKSELAIALGFRLALIAAIFALGYLFYLPFYTWYQELYVNGLGPVQQGTTPGDFLTIFGLWTFLALSFFLAECYRRLTAFPAMQHISTKFSITGGWRAGIYTVVSLVVCFVLMRFSLKVFLATLLMLGLYLFVRAIGDTSYLRRFVKVPDQAQLYTYLLLIMGVGICLGIELVYIRDFEDGSQYARMNTVFKFSIQAWLCFAIGGALAVQRLWHMLGGFVQRVWRVTLVVCVLSCSIFLVAGTPTRIGDHQLWVATQKPAVSANYTPTLDGFAFVRSWYPGDASAIEWLNAHVSGSPVILEAAAPVSYQWFNRVSVFTGLPDVIGWPDHVGEQRYASQSVNRVTDVGIIYSTTDPEQADALLHYYHVRYIYVGALERQLYAAQSSSGLDKFDHMADLHVVYRSGGVTIYEVV